MISPGQPVSTNTPPASASMVEGQLVVAKGERKKVFRADKVILLSEQSKEIRKIICEDPRSGIFNPQTVTIGPSGYSDVSKLVASGEIQADTYRLTCQYVLKRFITQLNKILNEQGLELPFVITHGASEIEVDKAGRDTANELNIRQFGFNQPEWMFYVPDDLVPTYVASNKDDYHNKFAAHTMILLILGGRDDAAYHDRLNCQLYRNLVLPCPILPFIMQNPPPAWDPKYDKERAENDPIEWANRVPILDASLAHLRSVPMPEVQRLISGKRMSQELDQLVDYLAKLGAEYISSRFANIID